MNDQPTQETNSKHPSKITVVDEAIAYVKSVANGRTRYMGQTPFWDELLVAEIERLRNVNNEIVSRHEKILDALLKLANYMFVGYDVE